MSYWVAGAVVVAAVGGAVVSSNASSKAAKAQQASANQANKTALDQYHQTRDDQAPWRTAGANALTQLTGNLSKGFTPNDLANEPGYQFELNQGMQGLDRSAASRGRLYSGAQMKAADTYANNFAGTKYNEAYNRWLTGNNELAGVAGVGQTATNVTDQAAQQYGQQYGNNVTGAGNAAASGYLARGNALTTALNSGTASYLYGRNNNNNSNTNNIQTNSLYGGGGTGYYDQNGSDIGYSVGGP